MQYAWIYVRYHFIMSHDVLGAKYPPLNDISCFRILVEYTTDSLQRLMFMLVLICYLLLNVPALNNVYFIVLYNVSGMVITTWTDQRIYSLV